MKVMIGPHIQAFSQELLQCRGQVASVSHLSRACCDPDPFYQVLHRLRQLDEHWVDIQTVLDAIEQYYQPICQSINRIMYFVKNRSYLYTYFQRLHFALPLALRYVQMELLIFIVNLMIWILPVNSRNNAYRLSSSFSIGQPTVSENIKS